MRMLCRLPKSTDILFKSFKSKLRSQIRRPLKSGLYTKIGGIELIDDFYNVFSVNMRDLGSPVHSKTLIKNVLLEFKNNAKIIVVHTKDNKFLAGSLVVGFKDTLENPWASALRKYSRLSPNMLLYWTMLEYACENGFKYFDFGRSSPEGGAYKFKRQWGAEPQPLYWYCISMPGKKASGSELHANSKLEKAAKIWKKLPVPVTIAIGPKIRKNIGL